MKSANSTATTVDFVTTNFKSTGGTVDLSRTNPRDKDKDKEKGKQKRTNNGSSLKKVSPYAAPTKTSGGKSKTEAQGPIDWTHLGIKLKYRGEKQREDAWELWKSSIGNAKKFLEDFNEILPVVKVERHPIYTMYFKRVAEENYESNTRTKSRLLMKKFILDVQELWLANLQHLREHQPDKMTTIKDEDEEGAENYMRGTGLDHRRDVKEIAGMQHQVQSVSQKRAFAQAYHTSRMPPPKVKLDYQPAPTPKLPSPKPIVPVLESIASTLSYTSREKQTGRSDAMYHYIDDAVVNYTDSVALHLDRCLPSSDFASFVAQDVLWRFTLMHSVALTKRVFLVPETLVAMYAAQLIHVDLTEQRPQPPPEHVVYQSQSGLPLPYDRHHSHSPEGQQQQVIEWQGQVTITVTQPTTVSSQLAPIRISVTVNIQPVEYIQQLLLQEKQLQQQVQASSSTYLTAGGDIPSSNDNSCPSHQFTMQLSPLELRLLLHRQDIPLFTLDWWLEEARLPEIWEPLIPLLQLEMSKDSSHSHQLLYMQQPIALSVMDPHYHRRFQTETVFSPATAEDKLTSLQAAACLYEVLPYLCLVKDSSDVPTLRLQERTLYSTPSDGSDNSMTKLVPPSFVEVQSIDSKYPYDSIRLDIVHNNNNNHAHNHTVNSSDHSTHNHPPPPPDWKKEAKLYFQSGRWEKLLEQGLNGSLLASQGFQRIYGVPGASEIGRRGLWFPDALDSKQEKTQVGGNFFRDAMKSTTDSILIHLTLLLETSILFPSETAWENFPQLPVAAIGEEANGVIPMLTTKPKRILDHIEPLQSPIEARLSSMIMIFSATAVEGIDYYAKDYETVVPLPQRPKGFRRYVPIKNKHGYREQIEVSLITIDPVVDATTFGITQQGAVANTAGVNPRNIWHNMVAVNEHICRPRTSKDYHYIVANPNHCGANIPTSYTTRMKALEMVGLTSSVFKNFEDAYAKINELRTVFTKQLALEAKIEKITNDLKIKEAMTVRMYQRKLQRQLERKLKKSTKSEEGWKRRFKASSLVEVQGNWERRQDDRNGLLFFHRLQPPSANVDGENFAETCQWDVPMEWDGEFWKIHNPAYTGNIPRFNGSSADGLLSQHDTLDSRYPFHTGDTVMVHGKAHHNPKRDIPQHLQNITVEHAGQLATQIRQKQTLEQQQQQQQHQHQTGFQEPRSDWHPAMMDTHNHPHAHHTTTSTKPPLPPLQLTNGTHGTQGTHAQTNNNNNININNNDNDALSELNSARADRSIADSIAPTIDTVNLEHIAEQLISSDEIMCVIAKRLGLPETQVVPADELSSVFTVASETSHGSSFTHNHNNHNGGLLAPRDPVDDHTGTHRDTGGKIDYDSDEDLWSDEDEEVGDVDMMKEIAADEDMPQNQLEYAQWRRRNNNNNNNFNNNLNNFNNKTKGKKGNASSDLASVPSQVPYLDLREVLGGETNADVEANQRRYNWRRLPRPVIKDNFLTQALKAHVKGPDPTSCNTLNTPIFLMPIAPIDACHYVPEPFGVAMESIFVPNVKKDMERSLATLDRNIKREEELARNMPTEDLLLFGEAKEFTSVERFLAKQYKADQAQVSDPQDAAKERALLAAKATNIAQMEDCLAEDIPINTADQFGNSLLILAAQQGSRRMCKFLLRRGASINMQNFAGNTALHYCYAYGNRALGEYLKGKGANDAIVNADGLTCYEGLSKDAMAEFYGDFEESDYAQHGQEEEEEENDDQEGGWHQDSVSNLGDSTVGGY